MKTKLIGQIHDSVIADVPSSEFKDYIEIATYITTQVIPDMWKWIIVPLTVEVEASPAGMSWFKKEKVC